MTVFVDQVHAALPHLSIRAQAILDALLLSDGTIPSATKVAGFMGLSSRFALARLVRHEGLPALHELSSWVSLLGWVTAAEQGKTSLFTIATRSGRSPALCYRTVKRLTGLTWVQLKARGSLWVLGLFLHRCQTISLHLSPKQARRAEKASSTIDATHEDLGTRPRDVRASRLRVPASSAQDIIARSPDVPTGRWHGAASSCGKHSDKAPSNHSRQRPLAPRRG